MQYTHSSYAQQPVQALPSSPFSQPHLLSSPSHAPPPAPSSFSTHHAVPFGAIPGSQPGVLGWGVGMSAANGAGLGWGHTGLARQASGASQRAASVGWGSAAASPSAQPSQQRPASPAPSSARVTPVNPRRRRRSASPSMSSDDDDTRGPPSLRAVRPLASASTKRVRRAPVQGESSLGQPGGAPGVGDLGKALASLDKSALLNILSRLLTTNPQLAGTISALLPTPSLTAILDSLASLERAVVSATPTGAFSRDEYVWSRVRVPLEEFVSEAKRFLSLFAPAQAPVGAISEEDLAHPSTAFQFLDALTNALLRLEATLPTSTHSSLATATPSSAPGNNPLASHLVPVLLNAWHQFLSRLSSAVNTQGRVLPTPTVRSWFDRLDDICATPAASSSSQTHHSSAAIRGDSQVRRAMEAVRDRARREIGWLVGLKPEASGGAGGMEGVEQEEEL